MPPKSKPDTIIPGADDDAADMARVAAELEARQLQALQAAEAATAQALIVSNAGALIGDDWSTKTADECLALLKAEGVPRRVLSSQGYVIFEL